MPGGRDNFFVFTPSLRHYHGCCCCWGFTALLLGFLVPASSLKQCPLVSARDTITE